MKHSAVRLYVLAACIMLLAACAHTGSTRTPCVRPVAGLQYCLLPTTAMTVVEATQLVHVQGADFEQYFVSRVRVTESLLVMNASSLLGQPMFEIRYSHENGASEVNVQPASAPVRAEWLLAMLQIAEADINDIRGSLSGATIFEQDALRRLLDKRDETVISIQALPNHKVIEIPSQQLVIRIQKLEVEKIAQ